MCVCVRARTTERVSLSRNRYRPVECLGEDWTRKRLRWQDHGERARLCDSVSLLHGLPTPNPSVVLSLALARSAWNERPPEHRRAASLHQPRINTSAGPYFRPRNLNFCTRRREPELFSIFSPSLAGDNARIFVSNNAGKSFYRCSSCGPMDYRFFLFFFFFSFCFASSWRVVQGAVRFFDLFSAG